MPKCMIAHEVPLGDGKFKVFELGRDYPEVEICGREKYFEINPEPKVPEKKRGGSGR